MQNIVINYVEQRQEVAPIPNYWNWSHHFLFHSKVQNSSYL